VTDWLIFQLVDLLICRTALYLVWPGFLTISAVVFAVASVPLLRDRRASKEYQVNK
jgi:hypothetical protein